MSEVDGGFVKRGLWTNLDEGAVMGRTITTDTRTGIIIIAITAVMSTVGTSHLWNLLIFACHQFRATGRPADGLFRQQQVILRTLPPSSSLMADSLKLWWAWRKRNHNVLARSIAQFMLATSYTVGFIAAGIFSSYVVSTSDLEVLVKSPLCGHLNSTASSSAVWLSAVRSVSTPYAKECYRDQIIQPVRCKAFVRPSIPFKTEMVPCPFSPELCNDAGTNVSSAVAFDSGFVDLNDGFGTNLPKHDRVSYRRRTTCSILPLAGHISIINASKIPERIWDRKPFPMEEAVVLHYGDRPSMGEWKNATTLASLLVTNLTGTVSKTGHIFYAALEREGVQNRIIPLKGLRRNDSDTAIIALIVSGRFKLPSYDPWLLVQKEKTIYDAVTQGNLTVYLPDSPARSMGCNIQFCFKNASGDHCSKLDGLPISGLKTTEWQGATPVQLSALELLIYANNIGLKDHMEPVMRDFLEPNGFLTVQVPSNQWIIEARAMESFVWASMQVVIADYAAGLSARNPALASATIKPETDGDKMLCGSIKMRKAGGFVNINVFGLCFIIGMSLFLAIVDIVLLKFLIFLSSFRKALSPRIDRWIQDGALQLQRRAYEARGQGTWSNLDKDVPLTDSGDMLDDLSMRSVSSAKPTALSTPSTPSTASLSPSHVASTLPTPTPAQADPAQAALPPAPPSPTPSERGPTPLTPSLACQASLTTASFVRAAPL